MGIKEYNAFLNNLNTHINLICPFKIYPSQRAVSLIYKNIEYKFTIKYERNKLYIEYIGLASSNSTRPYKHKKTQAEFELQEKSYDYIYNYMINTITNNKILF